MGWRKREEVPWTCIRIQSCDFVLGSDIVDRRAEINGDLLGARQTLEGSKYSCKLDAIANEAAAGRYPAHIQATGIVTRRGSAEQAMRSFDQSLTLW
jgi:hypothetical protein